MIRERYEHPEHPNGWPISHTNCRHIGSNPSRNWSQHAEGNALDIMKGRNTPNAKPGVPHPLDPIYAWLVENKKAFRLKNILWRVAAHYNHIHVDFDLSMFAKPSYVPPCEGGKLITVLYPSGTRGSKWYLLPETIDGTDPPIDPPPEGAEQMLKKGDKGRAVADVQRDLIEIHGYNMGDWPPYAEGYPDGADGDYGNTTVDTVKLFQADRGISPTGQTDALSAALILGAQRNEMLPDDNHNHDDEYADKDHGHKTEGATV